MNEGKNMCKKLFIFGNGFDIMHQKEDQFNTKYSNFRPWLISKCNNFDDDRIYDFSLPRYQTNYRRLKSYDEAEFAEFFVRLIDDTDNIICEDDELKKNLNEDIKSVSGSKIKDKADYIVKIVPPVKDLKLEEITRSYELIEKELSKYGLNLKPENIDTEKYKSKLIKKREIDGNFGTETKKFASNENREYSKYVLIFEIARYLNESPLKIKQILEKTATYHKIVKLASQYNETLYDEVMPSVFNHLYDVKEKTETHSKIVPLIKYRKGTDHFVIISTKNLTVEINDPLVRNFSAKSFHTDRYCFDSEPERKLFMDLIESDFVKEGCFTGMFTGSENGLSVQ